MNKKYTKDILGLLGIVVVIGEVVVHSGIFDNNYDYFLSDFQGVYAVINITGTTMAIPIMPTFI